MIRGVTIGTALNKFAFLPKITLSPLVEALTIVKLFLMILTIPISLLRILKIPWEISPLCNWCSHGQIPHLVIHDSPTMFRVEFHKLPKYCVVVVNIIPVVSH